MSDSDLPRSLGLADIGAVVVGGIIGVGIFFTPATLARQLPSPSWMLGLWVLGGAIALLGAVVLAELGARRPQAGGLYVFLRDGFGPVWGSLAAFVYGWVNLLVIQPAALAIIALVLVMNVEFAWQPLPEPWRTLLAMGSIAIFAAINAAGLRAGAGTQRFVTAFKLCAVAVLVVLGLGWGQAGGLSRAAAPVDTAQTGPLALVALGLIPVLFSYGGWQHGTFIAGRARDPERSVPWGITLGVSVVVLCYLLVNVAYLALLGQQGMADSGALAAEAAAVALGEVAGTALAVTIVVSAGGIQNTILLAFPYVVYAMGRDGLLSPGLAGLHPSTRTPVVPIAITAALAMVGTLAGMGRIDSLLAGLAFGEWASLSAVSFACLALRKRGKSVEFSGLAWAPQVFGVIAGAVAVGAVVVKPVESLAGLVVVVLSACAWGFRRTRGPA